SLYIVPEAPCIVPSGEIGVIDNTTNCPGDTTLLMAPAGYSTYVWSNNYSGQTLAVGDEGSFYVICIDSNGCASLTSTIEIKKVIERKPLIFSPEGNTICDNDSLILYSSPGENYKWSTGETGNSSITIRESGFYTVSTDAICTSGQLTSAPFQTVVLESPPPIANGSVILQGDSILLMAEGENCQWYDQPVGGNLLATGPFFQTMPLNSSATYFVESHFIYPGEIQTGGKTDTIGTGGLAGQAGYLLFDAWAPFNLLSVTVYVPSDGPLGTRFVQLWSGDSLLAFKRFELHEGANVFDLNFNVPVGKFSLQCQQGNLWRNTGLLDYPYLIGDVGNITSSSFGNGYYYFFYDWKIKKEDFECISDRTVVSVILSGTEDIENQHRLTIYPNPTTGFLFVDIKVNTDGANFARLLDANGREVFRQVLIRNNSFQLDLHQLPAGIYCLQVLGNKYFDVRKLVKN
ncbi:MAG: T9SS type A sorting domain-containing protein, partial [Saprospiraceae bacterium]